MYESIINLWADALESGDYEQGVGSMLKYDRYCCLGVLCDLHRKANAIANPSTTCSEWEPSEDYRSLSYLGARNHLPRDVVKWTGMTSEEIGDAADEQSNVVFREIVTDAHGEKHVVNVNASDLNDGEGSGNPKTETFEQIAVRVRAMVPSDSTTTIS